MGIICFLGFIGLLDSNGLLGFTGYLVLAGFLGFTGFPRFIGFWKTQTNCRLGEMSLGWMKLKIFYRLGKMSGGLGETQNFFIDLVKSLEGLVKLFMTSYRLGKMSGGFGETSYDQL